MSKVYAGARLRRLREDRGLTQVEFARVLAISPSYLNQIEHDSRPLTVTVLVRLTEVYGIDPAFFTPRDAARHLAELREALAEGAEVATLPLKDLEQVAASMPEVANAVVTLHRRYRDALTLLESATDRYAETPVSMPHEQVRDFFYRHQNYFDQLDRLAENLAGTLGIGRGEVGRRLRERLTNVHRIEVRTGRGAFGQTYAFDGTGRTLTLDPGLQPGQQSFRMAAQLAYLEAADEIDRILDHEQWAEPPTRALARIGLAHQFAAALVMPYGSFFGAAERLRYDVERLGEQFAVGFETVAHRLSTLQRSGSRGVPFIFVRVDRAGNISKRQSATSFHFSRSGGTCPLWNVYDAFAAPGKVDVQVAEMPDGQRYLWVARTVARRQGGYGGPKKTFVIGLGCELTQARRLVYSQGLDLARPEPVPIGPGCRTCDRMDCPQRATPRFGKSLLVDESRGGFLPYRLAADQIRNC